MGRGGGAPIAGVLIISPPTRPPTRSLPSQISDVKALVAAANPSLAGQTLVLIYQGKVSREREAQQKSAP